MDEVPKCLSMLRKIIIYLCTCRQYLVDSEEEGHTDDNQRARCFGEIGEEQERREWRMTLLKTHYMHM